MREELSPLLRAPEGEVGQAWFARIAELLLGRAVLVVGGAPHRLREIEFYYRGAGHPDPFAHAEALQETCGRWYFHRSGGSYRGGSFKGLDITFGPEDAHGGVLIRTLERPDGELVNGSSLCVDHILAEAGYERVAALDEAIDGARVWEDDAPLYLTWADEPCEREVLATARVGLTLKRADEHEEMPRYLMRPYRFVSAPTIRKGKLHTVIALHQRGESAARIRELTRCPRHVVARYVEGYEEGFALADVSRWVGASLKSADLARLHGAWERLYGA